VRGQAGRHECHPRRHPAQCHGGRRQRDGDPTADITALQRVAFAGRISGWVLVGGGGSQSGVQNGGGLPPFPTPAEHTLLPSVMRIRCEVEQRAHVVPQASPSSWCTNIQHHTTTDKWSRTVPLRRWMADSYVALVRRPLRHRAQLAGCASGNLHVPSRISRLGRKSRTV
jgi:hypothetical protein